MNRIRLTESQLHSVIKESVRRVLRESAECEASLPQDAMKGQQTIEKINALIAQANQAYEQNVSEWGNDCLMDKEGETYGLRGSIKLDMNGFLNIPVQSQTRWGSYSPMRIKVFTKAGGRYKLYKDEFHMDYDWRDAQKMLKQIVMDAQRYVQDMEGYNTEWEDSENPNPQAIRDFNKQIGVRADFRKP